MNKIVLALGVLATASVVGYFVNKKRKEKERYNTYYNVVEIKRDVPFDERNEFNV